MGEIKSKNHFIIGISGLSGSGKTFYIQQLQHILNNNIVVLSFDDYYKSKELQAIDENGVINFDLPEGLYHEKFLTDIDKLINGESLTFPIYQFQNYDAPPKFKTIYPAPIILVEGIFLYHFTEISNLINYKIFIETSTEISFNRRLNRDVKERNITEELSKYQWTNHVLPSFNNYVLPHKKNCDLVINNDAEYLQNIENLVHILNQKIPNNIKEKIDASLFNNIQ